MPLSQTRRSGCFPRDQRFLRSLSPSSCVRAHSLNMSTLPEDIDILLFTREIQGLYVSPHVTKILRINPSTLLPTEQFPDT